VREDFADPAGLDIRRRLYRHEHPPVDVTGLVDAAVGDCAGPVVEIGCGPGVLLPRLRVRTGWAVGLDLSSDMLRAARDKGEHVLVQADAAALPLVAGCAAAVVAVHVLYLVPDPRCALTEMARVVRPGGVMVVTTTGTDDKPLVWEVLEDACAGLLPAAEVRTRDVHRRWDIPAAVSGMERLGFHVVVHYLRAEIRLDDPRPLRDYIGSLQPLFASALPDDRWAVTMRRVDAALDRRIRAEGHLTTPTHVGIVVGRRVGAAGISPPATRTPG
jgi:SAM-dependent methyltransferase